MEQIPLAVTRRETTKKGAARRMRADGRVPAVIYGAGKENTLLSVSANDLAKVSAKTAGAAAFLSLTVEGEKSPRTAMLHEVQADYLRRKPVHVDFLEVRADQEQIIEVPLEFVGTPEGSLEGGIMTIGAYTLTVKGLLADIPDSIPVDVSELNINDSLFADAIEVPGDAEALIEENFVVVAVQPPAIEEEPEEEELEEGEEGEEGEGEGEEGASASESEETKGE